ncbi:MAG: BlaI/MecI/CopY family transcriptional regulator [Paraprevotella sp.]|nr:BlaI/MecI/CopY family transcriptional regulator [Paraprevotella sp.]
MKKLSSKEKEIMRLLWSHGPMFIRDILDFYEGPKPHYNTISTFVKQLIEKGYIDYKSYGNSYQYRAKISEDDYTENTIGELVSELYANSYTSIVSLFIKKEKISLDDLKTLIAQIENGNQ